MVADRVEPGDRIKLVYTDDPFTDLREGDLGTVSMVDDMGTIHVNWDSGSSLGLIPGTDYWKVVGVP